MSSQSRIESLIERERPLVHSVPEQIERLIHLNDNMVRRVTLARQRQERQGQRKG